jgi:hypothetical protein
MLLNDAIKAGLVSLVLIGERTHILANSWFPLEGGSERVAEHMFFCGGRPNQLKKHFVSREVFNEKPCLTCIRKYRTAKVMHGLSRWWVPKSTYTSPCLVPDES